MAAWPTSLPDWATVAYNVTLGFGDGRQVSPTDSGHVRRRRISSGVPDNISISMEYKSAELSALKTFWKTTLKEGVDTFTHIDPVTGSAATFAFVSPPTARRLPTGRALSELYYTVSFVLEQKP